MKETLEITETDIFEFALLHKKTGTTDFGHVRFIDLDDVKINLIHANVPYAAMLSLADGFRHFILPMNQFKLQTCGMRLEMDEILVVDRGSLITLDSNENNSEFVVLSFAVEAESCENDKRRRDAISVQKTEDNWLMQLKRDAWRVFLPIDIQSEKVTEGFIEVFQSLHKQFFEINRKPVKIQRRIINQLKILERAVPLFTSFNKFTVAQLASEACCSIRTLEYTFKEQIGLAAKPFLKSVQYEHFRRMLVADDSLTHDRLAAKLGIDNPSRFAAEFKEYYMMTPAKLSNLKKVKKAKRARNLDART